MKNIHLDIIRLLLLISCLASVIGFFVYRTLHNPYCLWDGSTIYGIGDNRTIIKSSYCEHSLCNREICDIRGISGVNAILIEPTIQLNIPNKTSTDSVLRTIPYTVRIISPIEYLLLYAVAVLMFLSASEITNICLRCKKSKKSYHQTNTGSIGENDDSMRNISIGSYKS